MPKVSYNPFHGHAKREGKSAVASVSVRPTLPGTTAERATLAGARGISAIPINNGHRERAYLRQTGRRSLTPRQRRRFDHKHNRTIDFYAAAAAEYAYELGRTR